MRFPPGSHFLEGSFLRMLRATGKARWYPAYAYTGANTGNVTPTEHQKSAKAWLDAVSSAVTTSWWTSRVLTSLCCFVAMGANIHGTRGKQPIQQAGRQANVVRKICRSAHTTLGSRQTLSGTVVYCVRQGYAKNEAKHGVSLPWPHIERAPASSYNLCSLYPKGLYPTVENGYILRSTAI